MDFHPEFLQGDLVFALGCRDAVPLFACGGVPCNNLAYPRGLLLGYITNASLDETGVAKYATLEPSCDLSKLEQIAIITEYNVQ